MKTIGHLSRLLASLAGAQVLLGLWALIRFPDVLAESGPRYPGWIFLVQVAVFTTVGAFLYLAGHRDRRAELLGLMFLIIAGAYSGRPLVRLATEGQGLEASAAAALAALLLVSYIPALGWELAGILPRIRGEQPAERLRRIMWTASIVLGTLFLVLNLAGQAELRPRLITSATGAMVGRAADLRIDIVGLALLTVPLFPFQMFRARFATQPERQRVRLLYAAIALGLVPINVLMSLEQLSPRFSAFMSRPAPSTVAGLIVFPALALIPITTAYLVLVHRVVEARVLLRRTLQYGLARSTIFAASLLPLLLLMVFGYQQRRLPLSSVIAGRGVLVLLALFGVVVGAARLRQRTLNFLDRRFFREQYDSQEILTRLVEAARWVDSGTDLASLITVDVDRALHLQKVDLLLSTGPGSRLLRSPLSGDELDLAARPEAVHLSTGIVELAPRSQRDPKHTPSVDELGLMGKGWALLAPLTATDGRLLGLLLIGEKKSELGFSANDRRLLAAVASSGTMALENLWARRYAQGAPVIRQDPAPTSGPEPAPAQECLHCGRVFSPEVEVCLLCEARLERARVPFLLAGKFALQRRLGQGGMGVVYLATDVDLERPVAVKTLPALLPERARALLDEARAMASVTHPSLATIYGAESWRGNPLLILEYLAGGDLRLRLRAGPLDVDRALSLALAIARALRRIHGTGMLHRDVKPSNVGFNEHGEPKLLDFGLARMLGPETLRRTDISEEALGSEAATVEDASGGIATAGGGVATAPTLAGRLVGTLAYLPPEALTGVPPTPAFDLWGLSMVLFESLVGRNPFAAGSREVTSMNLLKLDLVPIIEQSALPLPVKELLNRSLSRDPARRPRTAADLDDHLAAAQHDSRRARRRETQSGA